MRLAPWRIGKPPLVHESMNWTLGCADKHWLLPSLLFWKIIASAFLRKHRKCRSAPLF
jgi:hypothetical protein